MALAEARAAWQRTANRCLVQEDAKRAPKLACSSLPPSAKQTDTEPTTAAGGQDIPTTASEHLNQPSSYSNLSPSSRWWLHLQPNYGYQKCLADNELNSVEVTGNCQMQKISRVHEPLVEECDHIGQTKFFSTSPAGTKCNENEFVGYDIKKNVNEPYVDSETSWIGAERNIPWWRNADTEELASLVAERSHGFIENCDLPRPQNARVKKNLNANNISRFGNDKFVDSSVKHNPDTGMPENNAHVYTQWGTNIGEFCPKLRLESRGKVIPAEQLSYSPTSERTLKSHMYENDPSKAELLEALRHSQTRAREAEKVAEQACAQKEHVGKLVFKQASQIFAYKQWLELLQLETMYFQIKDNVHRSTSTIVPIVLPWTSLKSKKMRKSNWQKSGAKKRAKKARSRYDISKYALVFALGLGLVGAGLLLGWTVGWLLW